MKIITEESSCNSIGTNRFPELFYTNVRKHTLRLNKQPLNAPGCPTDRDYYRGYTILQRINVKGDFKWCSFPVNQKDMFIISG